MCNSRLKFAWPRSRINFNIHWLLLNAKDFDAGCRGYPRNHQFKIFKKSVVVIGRTRLETAVDYTRKIFFNRGAKMRQVLLTHLQTCEVMTDKNLFRFPHILGDVKRLCEDEKLSKT